MSEVGFDSGGEKKKHKLLENQITWENSIQYTITRRFSGAYRLYVTYYCTFRGIQ